MNQIDPITSPVHKSLSQPLLLAGCDREMFLFLTLLCITVGGPLGFFAARLSVGFAALIAWFVGRLILSKIAAHDAYARQVYLRSLAYRDFYPATASVTTEEKVSYGRW